MMSIPGDPVQVAAAGHSSGGAIPVMAPQVENTITNNTAIQDFDWDIDMCLCCRNRDHKYMAPRSRTAMCLMAHRPRADRHVQRNLLKLQALFRAKRDRKSSSGGGNCRPGNHPNDNAGRSPNDFKWLTTSRNVSRTFIKDRDSNKAAIKSFSAHCRNERKRKQAEGKYDDCGSEPNTTVFTMVVSFTWEAQCQFQFAKWLPEGNERCHRLCSQCDSNAMGGDKEVFKIEYLKPENKVAPPISQLQCRQLHPDCSTFKLLFPSSGSIS